MSKQQTRRHFTAEQKAAILKRHLVARSRCLICVTSTSCSRVCSTSGAGGGAERAVEQDEEAGGEDLAPGGEAGQERQRDGRTTVRIRRAKKSGPSGFGVGQSDLLTPAG
jgi:hypothetical protein